MIRYVCDDQVCDVIVLAGLIVVIALKLFAIWR